MRGYPSKKTILDWWARYPMTYGESHGKPTYRTDGGAIEHVQFATREFFECLDNVFYRWNSNLHTSEGYFGRIFPYQQYTGKKVLEIGCGLGTMAMNWAMHGAQMTAVDLNPASVSGTDHRFRIFGLGGLILQADANTLCFRNSLFDYIYSWGVLHHSPNLEESIRELFRVLKPGGGFGVMLYNRESIYHRYVIGYREGYLHAESRFLDRLQLASRYTDAWEQEGNPYTWPVTRREMKDMFTQYTEDFSIELFGEDIESSLFPKVGAYLPDIFKRAWARRWGWSMWISGLKR